MDRALTSPTKHGASAQGAQGRPSELPRGGESKIQALFVGWGFFGPSSQRDNSFHLQRPHQTEVPRVYLNPIPDLNDDFTINMSSEKRPASGDPNGGQLVVKRQNVGSSRALTRLGGPESSALVQAPRTSGLNAPVMELSGHSGEIFAAKFDPSGNLIASGSMDRTISTRCMSPLLGVC